MSGTDRAFISRDCIRVGCDMKFEHSHLEVSAVEDIAALRAEVDRLSKNDGPLWRRLWKAVGDGDESLGREALVNQVERLKEIEADAKIRLDDRLQRIDRLCAERDEARESLGIATANAETRGQAYQDMSKAAAHYEGDRDEARRRANAAEKGFETAEALTREAAALLDRLLPHCSDQEYVGEDAFALRDTEAFLAKLKRAGPNPGVAPKPG